MRAVGEFVARLVALVYMLLLVWTEPHAITRWCRHLPLGPYGLALGCAALVPGSSAGYACVVLPGAARAWWRGRFSSWPLVCAIGFPLWVRDSGRWMADYGFTKTVQWYSRRLVRGLTSAFYGSPTRAITRLRCRLGLLRECAWCHKVVPKSEGFIDLSV